MLFLEGLANSVLWILCNQREKNINIRRNQPAADIVSELRKSMTGEHNISDKVLYFNTLIETIKEAVE